ncbi:hypothetical protein MJO28_010431 [Puccinia striiformis f. sp. tritici]|uniref:Uncharacterized protein n=1 Tax=Puccinia striiformis f. sp. tritici TaxID=168172 RepID=A0ACC0E5V4_9BASI|nr:hypothetical protein MJO28_010431 [Puccinia striiformis f. sp. tritici]KAI7948509.1 hypothetical protein MJO29_010174 [Puccinia striiformis f. sp. tritici]
MNEKLKIQVLVEEIRNRVATCSNSLQLFTVTLASQGPRLDSPRFNHDKPSPPQTKIYDRYQERHN